MTDPGMADVTYIEPLTVESLTEIHAEQPDALLPTRGQTEPPPSFTATVCLLNTRPGHRNVDAIERGEDRSSSNRP